MAFMALVVVGCGGDETADEVGGTAPRRIVSLAPALTEILFALGVGDRVVGVTTYCDYPAEVAEIERVGGFVNPSVEAVLALEPDLVLVSPAAGNRDAAFAMRRAGARLEVVSAETLQDSFDAIERVGELCGIPDRGRRLAEDVRARIEDASSRVAEREPVRVLFSIQLDPLIVAGRGTLPVELVELAGGVSVIDAERYPMVGMELVVGESPEVIIQARMDTPQEGAERAAYEFWSRWPAIPAVRNERLLVIDGTTALRAGPRVADAVDALARALHPDIFAAEGLPGAASP
jgi:iron complex transport system substrate-binding protein